VATFELYSLMDWEPVEIGKKLRCGDWTRRASVLYQLKFMKVGYRSAIIIQSLNIQVWTELKLFQDSNRYHLAKWLWCGEERRGGSKM